MKIKIEFDRRDTEAAVTAGLKAVDLYEIGKEDIIRRDHLELFMEAALRALSQEPKQ